MAIDRGPTLWRRETERTPLQLSVNALKVIGAVLMVLYFFGACVVNNGILHISSHTLEEINELMLADERVLLWVGVSSMTSVVGVLGIPIFAYLLVQGVEHTENLGRYTLSVLALAVVSEVPYDLAMTGKAWDWSGQSSLWTALIALVMLWLLKRFQGKGILPAVLNFIIMAAGFFLAYLLRCQFSGWFVLIAAVLFMLREQKWIGYGLGALISLMYATAPLGFIPVALCNGRRKDMGRRKYVYYAFYPVMLGIFALCNHFLKGGIL